MSRIDDFLKSNRPVRMYTIIKKIQIRLFKYSIELRLLKEDSQ